MKTTQPVATIASAAARTASHRQRVNISPAAQNPISMPAGKLATSTPIIPGPASVDREIAGSSGAITL
jgi:hypothetical protein